MRLVDDFGRGHPRNGGPPPFDVKVLRAMRKVIPRGPGYSDNLGQRIAARLSGFRLDGVENPVAAVQNEVMKSADNPRPIGKAGILPSTLGFSSAGSGYLNMGSRCKQDLTGNFAGCRISDFDNASLVDREL